MQTCLGCDANEEFKISSFEDKNLVFLYIREETDFCTRLCLGSIRPFEMKMFNGMDQSSTSGPVVTSFHRYCRTPIHHCKCCCYQQLEIFNGGTQSIGKVQENCWFCVPSFNVCASTSSRKDCATAVSRCTCILQMQVPRLRKRRYIPRTQRLHTLIDSLRAGW